MWLELGDHSLFQLEWTINIEIDDALIVCIQSICENYTLLCNHGNYVLNFWKRS